MPRSDGSIVIDTKILEDGFNRGVKSLARATGRFAAGLGVTLGVAAAGLGAFAVSAVRAAEDAQVAEKRIYAIAESMGVFGDAAGDVAKRLNELADSQEINLGVDADIIKASQAKLLTFKELAATADEAGGAFDRATQATVDLAAAGFGSAEQNAVQLGKALQDPVKGITALARAGVTFTEQEKAKIEALVESGKILEAQDTVLKAIENQVGGTAEATAKSSEKLALAFNAVKDEAGFALLPVIESMLPAMMAGLDALAPVVDDIFGGLASVLSGEDGGADRMAKGFQRLITMASEGITASLPMLTDVMVALINSLALAMPDILPPLVDAILNLINVLAEQLGAMAPEIIPPVMEAIFMLAASIAKEAPTIAKSAVVLVARLQMAIWKGIGNLILSLPSRLKGIVSAIRSQVSGWRSAGGDLIAGLYQGISDKFDWLTARIKTFASNVTDKLKGFFGIKSPSRLFEREIGVNLALGIGKGFTKQMGDVSARMAAAVQGEMGRFQMVTGAGGNSSLVVNFNQPVRTYSEVVSATRRIQQEVAW